jgi:hypothetical protein
MLFQAIDSLWPWLAVAGLGVLHGLSPTSGWMFAAAWGMRERNAAQAWSALPPIAIGYATSIAMGAFLLARGAAPDPTLFRIIAGALLVGTAAVCLCRGAGPRRPLDEEASHAGIALWTFLMGSAHGAGLMLMPALLPMCLGTDAERTIAGAGSLAPALAAVLLHAAAMMLTIGVIASGVCHGLIRRPGLLRGTALRHGWPAILAAFGALLIVSC